MADDIGGKLYKSMEQEGAKAQDPAPTQVRLEPEKQSSPRARMEQMYARTMPSAAGAPRGRPEVASDQDGRRGADGEPGAPGRVLYPKMQAELDGDPEGVGGSEVEGEGDGEERRERQPTEPAAAPESPLDLEAPAGMDPADPILGEFKKVADELGLDGEGASRFLEMHERSLEAWRETWDAQVTSWEKAARDDQEIGGDRFDSSIGIARDVVSEFGTRELEEALDAHGYGNHPELVRLLVRVGTALRDARGSRR
ncbi:hypothetical protein [Anaeromyxobacter dehalogenans]|uniref:hypothetical protein n=1 Tax=Anaeromyxobacter dehalogenans TaxID=161493 RepID=UPI0012370E9B|nr:hypothetical protein [Anaeromyxobacter dehalogenans]